MTAEEKLYDKLAATAQDFRRPLKRAEWLAVAGAFLKALSKERKRADIDPRAKDIFNIYPRREGGDAALLSITKSLQHDGFEVVLSRTAEYAQAVARWAANRKRSQSGSSLIPLPTTFFNNRRYLDDPAQWWAGTGGREAVKKDNEEKLVEPENWRAQFSDSRPVQDNTPWDRIDLATQRYIVQHYGNG